MSAKLGYTTVAHRGCLAWYEDGEEGAIVGQENKAVPQLEAALKKSDPSVLDYWTVELAAKQWLVTEGRERYHARQDHFGITVESRAGQQKLKAACDAALKVLRTSTDRWPEWAKTALSNGWKPPKGWRP